MIRAATLAVATGALLWTALVPATGSAGEPRTHDGFFLRLSAGGGTASSKIDDEVAGSIELSGTPTDLNIAIGGMVAPNFALHGTLYGYVMSDPDVDITLPGLGSASGSLNGDATLAAFGGGATYYFMPVNVYLSGTVGFGSLELDGDVKGETDDGLVIDLSLGKEWWVGNSWGLGLAGGYGYHSFGDPDVDSNWSGSSFVLRFSATLN